MYMVTAITWLWIVTCAVTIFFIGIPCAFQNAHFMYSITCFRPGTFVWEFEFGREKKKLYEEKEKKREEIFFFIFGTIFLPF